MMKMNNPKKIYFLSIFFVLFCLGISFFLPNAVDTYSKTENLLLDKLLNYDSEHYLNIASNGYSEEHLYAFFPLYPFLIQIISFIGIPSSVAGIILAFIFFTGCFYLLSIIFKDNKNLNKILLYFGLSPISCLLLSAYTEHLFIFLTLLVYYFYKKDKFLLAGLFIGLSCMCRNFGFLLYVIFAINLLITNKNFKNLLKLSIPAILLGSIYPFYLFFTTGDLLKFSSVMGECWRREFVLPGVSIVKDIISLINFPSNVLDIILNLISLIIVGFVLYKRFKKEDLFLFILTIIGIGFPLFTCVNSENIACLSSQIRYTFQIFPLYLFLGNLELSKRGNFYFNLIYITLSFSCCTLFFMQSYIY